MFMCENPMVAEFQNNNQIDFSKQENSDEEKIKFVSRIYQNEILKKCIERNTIVYLPTGAGKTHIAIMALKHFAKVLLR